MPREVVVSKKDTLLERVREFDSHTVLPPSESSGKEARVISPEASAKARKRLDEMIGAVVAEIATPSPEEE